MSNLIHFGNISQSGIVFQVEGDPCPPTDEIPEDADTFLRQSMFPFLSVHPLHTVFTTYFFNRWVTQHLSQTISAPHPIPVIQFDKTNTVCFIYLLTRYFSG